MLCADGDGVPQDNVQAYMWAKLSVSGFGPPKTADVSKVRVIVAGRNDEIGDRGSAAPLPVSGSPRRTQYPAQFPTFVVPSTSPPCSIKGPSLLFFWGGRRNRSSRLGGIFRRSRFGPGFGSRGLSFFCGPLCHPLTRSFGRAVYHFFLSFYSLISFSSLGVILGWLLRVSLWLQN